MLHVRCKWRRAVGEPRLELLVVCGQTRCVEAVDQVPRRSVVAYKSVLDVKTQCATMRFLAPY